MRQVSVSSLRIGRHKQDIPILLKPRSITENFLMSQTHLDAGIKGSLDRNRADGQFSFRIVPKSVATVSVRLLVFG